MPSDEAWTARCCCRDLRGLGDKSRELAGIWSNAGGYAGLLLASLHASAAMAMARACSQPFLHFLRAARLHFLLRAIIPLLFLSKNTVDETQGL